MTETVTVAPTATPVTPAAAVVTTPVVAAVTPAVAPITVSTPGPVVAGTTPTAPAAGASLLDGTNPVAAVTPATPAAGATPSLEEAQRVVEAARLAAQPNSGAAWNLNDTTPGTGEKPTWFKSDKYANVAQQAAAYPELEKRFGAFTGAPKDGVYAMPDASIVKIDNVEDPVFKEFGKLASELHLNQAGYDKFLGLMGKYESVQVAKYDAKIAALTPNVGAEKAKLGPNADARIQAVANWAKSNLDEAGFQELRTAASGREMAATFRLLERIIAKSGGVKLPGPAADTSGGPTVSGLAEIREMQGKTNAAGQRLYDVDANYRKTVQAAYTAHFASNPVQRDRQGNVRG